MKSDCLVICQLLPLGGCNMNMWFDFLPGSATHVLFFGLLVAVIWSVKLLPSATLHFLCHPNMTPPLSLSSTHFTNERKLLVTFHYLPTALAFPAPLLRVATCCLFNAPVGSNNRDRRAKMASAPPHLPTLPRLAFSRGASPISVQPILMHVFRNKLASLLKSLLRPMNIWCGQSFGVEGYNDGALSFRARQKGSDSGPTQNPPVLSGDRGGALSRRSRQRRKTFFPIRPHLWGVKWQGLEMTPKHGGWTKTKPRERSFSWWSQWLTFGENRKWAFHTLKSHSNHFWIYF